MRRGRWLLVWRPSFIDQVRENDGLAVTSPVLQQPVEASRRQHMPLSLRAREAFANASQQLRYHVVTDEWFGRRVDDFVLQHYPEWDYDAVRSLVQSGHIYRYRKNGKKRYTRLTDRLEFDELVVVPTREHWASVLAPPRGVVADDKSASTATTNVEGSTAAAAATRPQRHLSAALRERAQSMVLFKNEHVIVINKPSGLPMMPTNNPTDMNVADMLPAWRYTRAHAPLVCHNLDAETSGCVVLARTRNAHRVLARMFVKRVVPNSVYWAFCVGKPTVNYGRIRMHFELHKSRGSTVVVARPSPTRESKVGIAEFVVNASALEYGSFVSLYPLTTRRHQERIMTAHALRCPVLGDALYGGDSAFPRALSLFCGGHDVTGGTAATMPLHLHHRKIQLPYKTASGRFICVTAPLPPHMTRTFKQLGWPCEVDDPLIPG